MTDRTPPHDIETEQTLLAAIMIAPTVIEQGLRLADVQTLLHSGEDFYRPGHQIIYESLCRLSERGEPMDALSVSAELSKRGELDVAGGGPYLHTCTARPVIANAGYYAKIVADKAVLRRLIQVGTRIAQFGYEGVGEVDDLVDAARAAVAETVVSSADGEGDLVHILDGDLWSGVTEEMEHGSDQVGRRVPTGFVDLDVITGGGFEPGQMVVVGARPSVGKSTVALDFSRGAVKAGHSALFFGLEMTNKELLQRWIAAEANVPLHCIRTGGRDMIDEGAWGRVTQARTRAQEENYQLWIADQCTTVAQIRANARRHQARHGRLDLVVVDYLQLIPSTATAENRQQAVSESSRALKLLAKELGVVVVALSQLNRKPEDRPDKRPQVSDLRESGAVEQDADVIILLYREDVHDKDSPRAGEADLIIGKHRNGPTCDVTVAFQGHYSRFVDMAPG
ncbi:replicative DNA helicase [Nocardiopsis sp. NPDC006938]|uniref:replicative DNA helicase n=1 Tax=Nocardiopsis sp. NPDC006938 TaxID=3364337 RepID=UPI00367DCA7D